MVDCGERVWWDYGLVGWDLFVPFQGPELAEVLLRCVCWFVGLKVGLSGWKLATVKMRFRASGEHGPSDGGVGACGYTKAAHQPTSVTSHFDIREDPSMWHVDHSLVFFSALRSYPRKIRR